jgi:hypothetical protein
MNWRTIAAKLTAGEIHYVFGRFYGVRHAYGVISGLRWPASLPDTQAESIFKQGWKTRLFDPFTPMALPLDLTSLPESSQGFANTPSGHRAAAAGIGVNLRSMR